MHAQAEKEKREIKNLENEFRGFYNVQIFNVMRLRKNSRFSANSGERFQVRLRAIPHID